MSSSMDARLKAWGLRPEDLGPPISIRGKQVAEGFAGTTVLAAVLVNPAVSWVPVAGSSVAGVTLSRAEGQPWAVVVEGRDRAALHCDGPHTKAAGRPEEVALDLRDATPRLIWRADGTGLVVTGGDESTVQAVVLPTVEVPMETWQRVARDPWLAARVADLGAHATLIDAAHVAGDLVRLAPNEPVDLQAILAGGAVSALAEAVHPWVAALSAEQGAIVQRHVDAAAGALDAAMSDLLARYDPRDAAWCTELAAWLSARDEAASAAWVVAALGQTRGTALADLDRRHRAELLGFVDLPEHPHPRLERALADDEAWWAEVFP